MHLKKAHILLLTAGIVLLTSPGAAQERDENTPEGRAAPVATAQVSEQYHEITVVGRLEPMTRIVHYATGSGYVLELSVEEGGRVEAGQKLFSIRRKDDVINVYKPTVVTARIGGWVSKVHIQEEDEITSGDPAVVLIGTEGYVLEAAISDKDAFKVRIGQRVTAHTAGGKPIGGVLVNRSQEPDYSTGLFSLTFHFPNKQHTYVGEFVMISLPTDRSKGLFIGRDLVIRRYGRYFVWIVTEDKTLLAREVVLGPSYGDLVKIESGLSAGERYLSRLTGREKEGAGIETAGR